MSMADDLATMARVGGDIIYYTGQSIGQGIRMAVDAYNWMNEDEEDDEEPEREAFALPREPPINEEVFEQTQHIIRRGASRSRSPEQNEQEGLVGLWRPKGPNHIIHKGISYIHIHIFTYIKVHIYIYMYIYMCIYTRMYTYIHIYIYVYIHMYVCKSIYTCIHEFEYEFT